MFLGRGRSKDHERSAILAQVPVDKGWRRILSASWQIDEQVLGGADDQAKCSEAGR